MATKTLPFDAAQYLTSTEAQAELIADAFESGDVTYIATAIGTVARARGMTQIAREAGVTREALYKSLATGGDPRLSTVLGVMKALGIRLSAEVDRAA
jgi:probable addiction module antidote protein